MVRGSGHHVYADKADEFNNLVRKICRQVDSNSQRSRQNSTTVQENVASNSLSDSIRAHSSKDTSVADFDEINQQKNMEMEIETKSQCEVAPSSETPAIEGDTNKL